jgi:hypothetical protein
MKNVFIIIILIANILFISCNKSGHHNSIKQALIFHSSFDLTTEADYSFGESGLYTRTALDNPAVEGFDTEIIKIEQDAGKFGGALRKISVLPDGHRVFYPARDNVAYSDNTWGGAVSYWLNLDPNADLPRNYCDPIQFMNRRFNDASIWQDFTGDKPRDLRVGMFPDGKDNINTNKIPEEQQPVYRLNNPGWKRGEWHHLVISWDNINSEKPDAVCTLYLDGKNIGGITGKTSRFTWDLERTQINVGVNYVGLMDDLAIFNRALTESEVLYLHGLENGIHDIR